MADRKPVATISVVFHDDGDATFAFDVNKDGARPTTETVKQIAFAKVVSDLVLGIMESQALPSINQLIEHVQGARDDDE